ncbi:MAG: tetratricopeptide repeat protein [Caldilineaceae bacterium]
MLPAQLLIRRHSPDLYAISFIPLVAIAPAWTPVYSVMLTPTENEELAALLNRMITLFTHGAGQPGLDALTALGRRLTECFLPEPIRQALNHLPPQSPLLLVTNAPEIPWELLCPGDEVLALVRPIARQYLDEQRWEPGLYEHWQAKLNAHYPPTPALLLIANPDSDLEASDVEADHILGVIDALPQYVRCTAIFRGQAKRSTVLAELQSGAYLLIHYSGHADTTAPPLSAQYLRLADGALFAPQLAAALAGAPLVFLNGCGSTQPQARQELMTALLRAGARSCIGALWPISDLASADFSATFYQRLLSGGGALGAVGTALWQARRTAYALQPDDPTWAAFVLYGDPTWQPVPPPVQTTYLATVLIVRLAEAATKASVTLELLQQWTTVISEWGGVVWQAGVDGLWATFGIPEAQEDQVQRAVQAAWALRAAHSPLAGEQADAHPPLVIALATGSVMVHTATPPRSSAILMGPTVSVALALTQGASADEIWAEPAVYQASKGLFTWAPYDQQRYRLLTIQPAELLTPAYTPFVGRQAELDNLLAHWRRCQQRRQRQVVGVVGEAGIGKTRLIHALHQRLQEQPEVGAVRWIGVRCPAHLSTSPFALLRALLAQGLGVQTDAPVEQWRQALTHLFVAETDTTRQIDLALLEQSLGLQPSFTEGRDVAEGVRRAQLVAVLKTLLTHLCQAAPLLLAIDDIYHADEPSLDVINQLIESLDALPLCWLALYRREWLPPWANKRRCHTLDMDELDLAERTELLATLLPPDTATTIQAAILERAGGNPLYLEQLAYMVRDSASFAGAAFQVSPALLPSTLRLTVQARAARLPAATQTILKLAAVAGAPFDPALLAIVLQQTGEAIHLEPALRELVSREFLRLSADHYLFSHPLLAEVIYAELPNVERQTFHRRLADALAEQSASSPTLVAWHRLRSVTRPQADGSWIISPPPFGPHYLTQVLDSLLAASEAAWQSYANREVIRWCQAGLDLLPHLAPMSESPAAVVSLHTWLGKAWARLGDFDPAIEHLHTAFAGCLAVIASAPKADFSADPQLSAADLARQIGRLRMRQGHYAESLDWMVRGREFIGNGDERGTQAMRALIEVHTGAVYHWQGNLDQAAVHYQLGIALAEQLDNPVIAALAEGCNGLGVICDERGQVDQAIGYFTRALQTWRALGDEYEATRVQENLGNAYFYRNDWALAQTNYQQSLTFWERIEDRHHIPFSLVNLGGVHLCQGQWPAAEHCYTRALELWEAVGEVRMTALAYINLGRLALVRRLLPAAHTHLERALSILDQQAVDSFRAEACATLAELYLQENAPKETLIWAQRALAVAQQQELRLEQGIAHRLLGQAYRQDAKLDLALAHLQRSVAQLSATANRHELARTWVALAVLEQSIGQAAQAQLHLGQASALFAELGAQPDCEQVQQIIQGGRA